MTVFVTQLSLQLAEKLRTGLLSQGFVLHEPPYTLFSGKKKGISCTLYQSGKLVVQGKEMREFIEFYLEPELLHAFPFTHHSAVADTTSRIGVDESGKGDFFGPLCIAAVHAEERHFPLFAKWGVCDSKKIGDAKILTLAPHIRKECRHHIVSISPQRYNEMYARFRNLNHLLAWGHATAITDLITQTGCENIIVDQFANEKVLRNALQKKNIEAEVTQRPRAEEDPVVAAASILARASFLEGIDRLQKEYGMKLPKGASSLVVQAGKAFVARHGRDHLSRVAKMHFKTLDELF